MNSRPLGQRQCRGLASGFTVSRKPPAASSARTRYTERSSISSAAPCRRLKIIWAVSGSLPLNISRMRGRYSVVARYQDQEYWLCDQLRRIPSSLVSKEVSRPILSDAGLTLRPSLASKVKVSP